MTMTATPNTKISQLAARIQEANDAYYNGNPIMSDAAFDSLQDELRRLDPSHPVLLKIGAPAPSASGWPKAKHTIPMSSLNKAQVLADMTAWYDGCKGTKALIVMDKLDGGSIDLVYENRRLVQAITRGDGQVGEEITRNALLMKGAVKMLPPTLPDGRPTPAKVYVRGEVIVTHDDFKRHFPGESNPRNTANGTMKRQSDPAKCAHLTVIAYNLMPNGVSMPTKSTELTALKTMGFLTPQWEKCLTLTVVESVYQTYVANKRKATGYDIDGLVVEFDEADFREGLGDLNGKPKGSIAYKFPHESKETFLRTIRWQVGNSGRLTPVAEFDTVNLGGANVKQASLHNISNIRDLVTSAHGSGHFLRSGDRILVSRRNDVIPYVESLLIQSQEDELLPPKECPACKAAVQRDGEYLVCRNEDCEAQAAGAIKRWVKKIGVLHVGETLIEALIDAGFVEDPADLYNLDPAQVADLEIGGRRVGGSADKAITNLNAKKVMPIHVFVGSLGLSPLIGRSMVQTIADAGYNTLSKMAKAKIADIAAIPGVGQTKAEAFVLGFQAKMGLMGKLVGEAGIEIQQASGALLGQTFCLTGFRDADLSAALEKAGASEKSSVSKGLTFLIALDPTSTSGKAQKARQYGTKVIGPDEAWDLVGGKQP